MTGWLIFIAYTELYSAGLALFARRCGVKRYGLCLIPFAAFFFVDKLTGGFKLLGIRVNSWGKLVITLVLVTLAAYLYGLWGINHLNEKNIEPLLQIMWVPAAFCIFIFYVGCVQSTLKLLYDCGAGFRGAWAVCLPLVTLPFLLAFSRPTSGAAEFTGMKKPESGGEMPKGESL